MEGEGRGMYCIDINDELEIIGNENDDDYARLDIVLLPCNYIHTMLGYTDDSVYPECVPDL